MIVRLLQTAKVRHRAIEVCVYVLYDTHSDRTDLTRRYNCELHELMAGLRYVTCRLRSNTPLRRWARRGGRARRCCLSSSSRMPSARRELQCSSFISYRYKSGRGELRTVWSTAAQRAGEARAAWAGKRGASVFRCLRQAFIRLAIDTSLEDVMKSTFNTVIESWLGAFAVDDEPLALRQIKLVYSTDPVARTGGCMRCFAGARGAYREDAGLLFSISDMPDQNGLDFVGSLDGFAS